MPHTVYSNTDTVALFSTITSLEVDFKSEKGREGASFREPTRKRISTEGEGETGDTHIPKYQGADCNVNFNTVS